MGSYSFIFVQGRDLEALRLGHTNMNRLAKLIQDESAPTAVEYVLMAAGIALVILVAVVFFGGAVSNSFDKSAKALTSPPP
jgi:Flp pilus assembly pilin Flp